MISCPFFLGAEEMKAWSGSVEVYFLQSLKRINDEHFITHPGFMNLFLFHFYCSFSLNMEIEDSFFFFSCRYRNIEQMLLRDLMLSSRYYLLTVIC